ncbi:MAG: methyltransferase domain-containing protein [Candidatus Magasanikbacteria bacterium]
MNPEMKPQNPSNNHKGLEMYFSPEIAEKFAELEQNEKNFKVAQIVDAILLQESADIKAPIFSAELGGGAHPDRYDEFFSKLDNEGGHMDWVDVAPLMLELAKKYISNEKYQNRKNVITFIKSEILEYLRNIKNKKLDLAIMKYTIDHIESLDELFKLLSEKLAQGGKLIATIGSTSPELKSHSTNARFLYNGEQFPDNETRTLKDGDNFTVKFFKVSGDPTAGYLEGAETLKYYHSAEKIKQLAESFGFDIFLGDWKDFVPQENQKGEMIDQDVLVLTKK